jgi:hypothetical protein
MKPTLKGTAALLVHERGWCVLILRSGLVRPQRAFLVSWATQQALALCRRLGIQEPELSGEVKRLVEVPAVPP